MNETHCDYIVSSSVSLPSPSRVTSLILPKWKFYLRNCALPDAAWVLDGIEFGFSLGVRENSRLRSSKTNCISATKVPQVIDDYLAEELKHGTFFGPCKEKPLPDLHINRFGIIPKSTPGKWRLITDLSFPSGNSVNDFIPDGESAVSYVGIPEAIDAIMSSSLACFMAKFDLKRAYRLLPIKTKERNLLGMFWKEQFYVDLALPFGVRSAPKTFTRFADILQWIFETNIPDCHIQHYLDDFLIICNDSKEHCQAALEKCFSLCTELGVIIAADKTEGPSQKISFLGFIVDSVNRELSLPIEKIDKINRELVAWENKPKGTKRELLSLIGSLQHCCMAITLGRPFLRRLIDRAYSVSKLDYHVRLSLWERDDIGFWQKLFKYWNGRSLFLFPKWEKGPDIFIKTDAAGNIGFAAIYGNEWFADTWPKETDHINIAVKEMIPIVLAAQVWGLCWKRKRIEFVSDNNAVVACLQKGSCRDRHLAFLLRELSIIAITVNFSFTASHIAGVDNREADTLSRSLFQEFRCSAPDADTFSQKIPAEFLHKLLFPVG